MIAVVLLWLLLAVIDLGRDGYTEHLLDGAAGVAGANSSGSVGAYAPTPLDLTSPAIAAQIQADLVHAASTSNGAIGTAPLVARRGQTLSNGQVTVLASPSLATAAEITVTLSATFTPAVGVFLRNGVLHLQATAAALTPLGQNDAIIAALTGVPTSTATPTGASIPSDTPTGTVVAATPTGTATAAPVPTDTDTPTPMRTNTPTSTPTHAPAYAHPATQGDPRPTMTPNATAH